MHSADLELLENNEGYTERPTLQLAKTTERRHEKTANSEGATELCDWHMKRPKPWLRGVTPVTRRGLSDK